MYVCIYVYTYIYIYIYIYIYTYTCTYMYTPSCYFCYYYYSSEATRHQRGPLALHAAAAGPALERSMIYDTITRPFVLTKPLFLGIGASKVLPR